MWSSPIGQRRLERRRIAVSSAAAREQRVEVRVGVRPRRGSAGRSRRPCRSRTIAADLVERRRALAAAARARSATYWRLPRVPSLVEGAVAARLLGVEERRAATDGPGQRRGSDAGELEQHRDARRRRRWRRRSPGSRPWCRGGRRSTTCPGPAPGDRPDHVAHGPLDRHVRRAPAPRSRAAISSAVSRGRRASPPAAGRSRPGRARSANARSASKPGASLGSAPGSSVSSARRPRSRRAQPRAASAARSSARPAHRR